MVTLHPSDTIGKDFNEFVLAGSCFQSAQFFLVTTCSRASKSARLSVTWLTPQEVHVLSAAVQILVPHLYPVPFMVHFDLLGQSRRSAARTMRQPWGTSLAVGPSLPWCNIGNDDITLRRCIISKQSVMIPAWYLTLLEATWSPLLATSSSVLLNWSC